MSQSQKNYVHIPPSEDPLEGRAALTADVDMSSGLFVMDVGSGDWPVSSIKGIYVNNSSVVDVEMEVYGSEQRIKFDSGTSDNYFPIISNMPCRLVFTCTPTAGAMIRVILLNFDLPQKVGGVH